MTDKRQTYHSDTLALPPLKMVLGDIPDPDPDDKRHLYRAFDQAKSEAEARNMVTKLISRLKTNDR